MGDFRQGPAMAPAPAGMCVASPRIQNHMREGAQWNFQLRWNEASVVKVGERKATLLHRSRGGVT